MRMYSFFFFFQAEDGIRDLTVTGVQTCALPISGRPQPQPDRHRGAVRLRHAEVQRPVAAQCRSEERRVGKSVDLGGRRIIKKKKKKLRSSLDVKKQNKVYRYDVICKVN